MALAQGAVSEGQLTWRCRRGMRELDELLTSWLRQCYSHAGADQQSDFQSFLELPDSDIAAYLLGTAEPEEPRQRSLVHMIRTYRAPAG